jgi:guanosine-3',5'-bis(diphosphate) 3'-pyrophosphohydrolase
MALPADTVPSSPVPPSALAKRQSARDAVSRAYQAFRAKVASGRPGEDLTPLDTAYEFARARHEGQDRADGQPYITHPIEVAEILAIQGMDMVCLMSALLHDVLEDTATTAEEIRRNFGEEVLRCVEGVTKIGKLHFYSREDRQAESVRKMLIAMVSDIRVILVKFADRLHNLRTLGNLAREKQARIAQETLEVYCPIAHRLGMGKIRAEMEDHAFRFLEPEAFATIVETIQSNRNASEEFLQQIKTSVEKMLAAEQVPARVEARLKRPYSVWQKMKKQRITIHQVYDLLALRIITDSVKNCYAALGVIHAEWSPIPGRIKDFIAIPRPNLYQSLHTSVMVPGGQVFEVQIRTQEMHRIAEEGIAAHWKYKEGKRGQAPEDQRIQWLRQLVEWQKDMGDPSDFHSTLKLDLQQEDVFVFSPQGRVVVLPHDASPVDFAYAIHSDIGNTCTGAKVNQRIVPLRHALQNGDVVEIQTQAGSTPSRDWLAFVKTGKAKSKIRHFITEVERERSIEIGQKYLETEARRLGVAIGKVPKAQMEYVANEYGFSKIEDLHAALGYGRYSARQVLAKLAPDQAPAEEKPAPTRPAPSSKASKNDLAIRVKGHADLMSFRAKCCNPILGEPIVGYVTRGRGVAVHSSDCKNVRNLMYECERKIDVEWESKAAKDAFVVKLQIRTDDRPGLLAHFTSILANENCNIRTLEARSAQKNPDEGAVVDMTIEVRDKKQFDKISAQFRRTSGVRDVSRIQ